MISLFWVSAHDNVSKHCLDFEMYTLFNMFFTIETISMPLFAMFRLYANVHVATLRVTIKKYGNKKVKLYRALQVL